MSNERTPDVLIIGLGAAGGIAAHVLTQAGLDVVGLDAGPRITANMMTLDEVRNDVRSWMSTPKSRGDIPTWRESPSQTARLTHYPVLMVNGIGGTSIHYNCASPRYQPWHFESRTRIVERYGEKAIPENSNLTDWPMTYDELEPYYDIVEYAIGVSGQAGNIQGKMIPGGNPFEGPRSRDYPMPALRPSGWNTLMGNAAREMGLHPYMMPSAINTQPYNGNPACTYCGFCVNNGCYHDAKGSLDVTLIRDAEATGRLKIETMARVVRIEVGADGRASGVTYVRDGREHFQEARFVLVGGFTFENTRLLLLSGSGAYPNGLSNNHGQVGKNFMVHGTQRSYGAFPGRKLNRFYGSGGQIMVFDDLNADNFDHSGLGFIGGAFAMAMHETKSIQTATQPLPPDVQRWGSDWKSWIGENGRSIGRVNADMEDLPYTTNYLDLDPVAKDPFGVPLVRVTHKREANEETAWQYMKQKLAEWLTTAGATKTWSMEAIRLDTRHPFGGTCMGNDPATSVVDAYGFSHEVPNLGVIGASVFPTTGGHNPTLTLQALTWRTAEHLANELAR